MGQRPRLRGTSAGPQAQAQPNRGRGRPQSPQGCWDRTGDRNGHQAASYCIFPSISSDLNPIEVFLAKLKALLGKAAQWAFPDLWRKVGPLSAIVAPSECMNFKHAGYALR